MTVISNFLATLKDSLMIYICGKFELPDYKSKVEIRTSSFTENYCSTMTSFSAVMRSSKSR